MAGNDPKQTANNMPKDAMNRFSFLILVLAQISSVFATDLIETNGEFDGLPDVVVFDCFPSPDKSGEYFEPLNRRMRIPENFEQAPDDTRWLNWNVRIVGEDGPIVARYAAIQFGELNTGIEWIEREFIPVSRAAENGYGVDIYLRAPQPEDAAHDYWVFYLSEKKFLKVIARTEIDWNSLLTCFE